MNTPADIASKLSSALEIVDAAKVPNDLRAVAFWQACVALDAGVSGAPYSSSTSTSDTLGEDALLGRIARRLSLDYEIVTAIFEQKGDEIQLIVPKGKLPNASSKAASMRDIALLLTAGRQAAELEDYTPLSLIRKECDELGMLDSGNFSAEIGRLGMRAQGGRNSREIRASRHQLEQAAELMSSIAGA